MLKLADNLSLSTDVVTDVLAILARRDGGKTYCGLKLFELMHAAGAQCVAIDPVAKWWSLRLAADGKSPGIDLPIFGGPYGDLPLEATGGALIARVIVERDISAVIDVSLFEDHEMKHFVTDFARELYRLKQRSPSAMHLFVEEASMFCPQDKEDGSDPPMLRAMRQLVRRARNYGVGVTLIDQRAQDVNKKLLNQAGALIVLGTSGTTDRKAIEKWVSDKHIDTSDLDGLASLDQGHAFVWLPRKKTFQQVHIAERWTYDASKTPKLGAKRKERKLTPTDVSALREVMAESVKRVEENDPKALRRKIIELEKKFVAVPSLQNRVSLSSKIERVEVPILTAGHAARLEAAVNKLVASNNRSEVRRKRVIAECEAVTAAISAARNMPAAPRERQMTKSDEEQIRPFREGARRSKVMDLSRVVGSKTSGDLGGVPTRPQQRVLDAIAWYEAMGIMQPSRQAVAIKVGVRISGSFTNNLGALRTAGFIDYPTSGAVRLTEAGRAQAEPPEELLTNETIQKVALDVVTGPQAKILEILIKAYPNAVERETVAEKLGIKVTGSFNNNLGAMRTMGLLDYPQHKTAVATALLFPEG